MSILKVMLADDHEVVRMGLRMVLEQVPDTQIVAEVGSADEAIRLCETHQPHVVIMDIRMPPGSSGIDACRTITERWSHIQVIMLTSFADAICAGAVGYVLKQAGTGELVQVFDEVRQGAALLDPGITHRALAMMRRRVRIHLIPLRP